MACKDVSVRIFAACANEEGCKVLAQSMAQHCQERHPDHKQPGVRLGTVNVDVDFLNPFVTSVKKSALDTWRRLPPQAQLALPFVATGATTGLIVYKIQGGRLRRQVLLRKGLTGPNKRLAHLACMIQRVLMLSSHKSRCCGLDLNRSLTGAVCFSVPAEGEDYSSASADRHAAAREGQHEGEDTAAEGATLRQRSSCRYPLA